MLEDEPETLTSCPLDEDASDDVKIDCARSIDIRLQYIHMHNSEPHVLSIPEIRLELQIQHTPSDSEEDEVHTPTTLVQAKPFNSPPVHRKHLSALLRLLYIHSCLNPANQVPHIPALLVPLYSTLTWEIEPADVAHAEASTFWLFEVFIRELVEFEEEEGGKV